MRSAVLRHPWLITAVLAVATIKFASLFSLQALGVVANPDKTVNAHIDRLNGVDATDFQCMSSSTFTDMPAMSRSFTIDGATGQKVAVMFTATSLISGVSTEIQLVVDGLVQSGPKPVLNPGDPNETNGFNFISDTLAPGSHTAKIQWRSLTGVSICIEERSMVVLHNG